MAEIRFFNDEGSGNLQPLTHMRDAQDLRCGILTLKEKAESSLKKLKTPFSILLNGRVLVGQPLADEIKKAKSPVVFMKDRTVVAALVKKTSADKVPASLDVPKKQIKAFLVEFPWDLIYANGKEIGEDVKRLGLKPASPSRLPKQVFIVNKKAVFIGKNVTVKPGVVLDAENGPIVIDDNAVIMSNSVIMGPVYIGKGSTVKAIAKIYGGTTVGPMCKIGGELEATIFHGYSNKQHDGFLGHSYISEWVNLGADTNNSDLKNNYENVRVQMGSRTVDTGRMFMGLVMGDHSKSGINSMFNTGTIAGVSCNIFGSNFPDKYIPSFSWGGGGHYSTYDIERAVKTARAVMKRRNVEMSKDYENRFREVFALTSSERKS